MHILFSRVFVSHSMYNDNYNCNNNYTQIAAIALPPSTNNYNSNEKH